MNQQPTVITAEDLEEAREIGRLSGGVRVLKWAAAIAITVNFAFLSFLVQQVSEVRNGLSQQIAQQFGGARSDLTQQITALQEGQAAIRERLASVGRRLDAHAHL